MNSISPDRRMLRRQEAAEYIQATWNYPCSPKTLAKYACVGGGPSFRLAGRWPLYAKEDLDTWITAKIGPLVRSTSESQIMKAAEHLDIYQEEIPNG